MLTGTLERKVLTKQGDRQIRAKKTHLVECRNINQDVAGSSLALVNLSLLNPKLFESLPSQFPSWLLLLFTMFTALV